MIHFKNLFNKIKKFIKNFNIMSDKELRPYIWHKFWIWLATLSPIIYVWTLPATHYLFPHYINVGDMVNN